MNTQDTQSLKKSFGNGLGQDTKFKADLLKVNHALKVKPMTMKEVDVYTGVMCESVCRHISTLLEREKITITRQGKYSITSCLYLNVYMAIKSLFLKPNQLNVF